MSSQGSELGGPRDQLRLMAVHAHPDDESSKGAATMARYVARGRRSPRLHADRRRARRHPQPGDGPAGGRARTWPASGARRWTGRARSSASSSASWASSTPGCPEGDPKPPLPEGCFALVPLAEAARPLVKAVREFRPHVIMTYDENGGYPHPDHIKTHEVSVEAFEAAADPDRYPDRRRALAAAQDVLLRLLPPGQVRRDARGDDPARPRLAVYEDLRGVGGTRPQARRAGHQGARDHHPGQRRPTTSRSGTARCWRTPPRSTRTARGSPARSTSSAPRGPPRTIILLGRSLTPSCRKTTFSRVSGRV